MQLYRAAAKALIVIGGPDMRNMASMLWRGRRWWYIVALHGRRPPSQTEWDEYCRLTGQAPDTAALRGVVFTLRGAPNARQRAQNLAVHRAIGVPRRGACCVITDSHVVRGIMNAFTWAGVMLGMHAFATRDLDAALAYVDLDRDEAAALLDDLVRLGDTIDDANPVRVALGHVRRRAS